MTARGVAGVFNALSIGALLLVLTGCETLQAKEVKAWERGYLSLPEMAADPDPTAAAYREHAYFSKEAASGSASVGGGGCGCN